MASTRCRTRSVEADIPRDWEGDYTHDTSVKGCNNNIPYDHQDEMDHGLKMAHVDMYKFKLRERERRKRVAREHQLVGK